MHKHIILLLLEVRVKCGGVCFGLCVCVRALKGLRKLLRLTERAGARLWRDVCGNGNHLSY